MSKNLEESKKNINSRAKELEAVRTRLAGSTREVYGKLIETIENDVKDVYTITDSVIHEITGLAERKTKLVYEIEELNSKKEELEKEAQSIQASKRNISNQEEIIQGEREALQKRAKLLDDREHELKKEAERLASKGGDPKIVKPVKGNA